MNALGKYWVIYYLVYVLCIALFVWQRWADLLHGDNRVHLMAAGSGVSAGVASIFAIGVEVVGRTMLLIPAAVRRLIAEGQQKADTEWEAWLKRRDEARTNANPSTNLPRLNAEMAGTRQFILPDASRLSCAPAIAGTDAKRQPIERWSTTRQLEDITD